MNAKYIHEKLDGTLTYPQEIEKINSREDLRRWWEWTAQFSENDDLTSFRKKLNGIILEEKAIGEYLYFRIKFARCKSISRAVFYNNECFQISVN